MTEVASGNNMIDTTMIDRNTLIAELYEYQEEFYANLLELNRQQLWNMTDEQLVKAHKIKIEDHQ